jgi:prevent-host-death family protein
MKLSLTEADNQLTELARLAENGDEVVLTRDGREVLKLVPITRPMPTREEKLALLESIIASAKAKGLPDDGPDAARSQDFLYDEFGLPK